MPIRLLLIEDSDDDALLIQGHFRRADIEVDGVRVDTAEGLAEAFQAGTPDVVICDYNMPSFSAHEALQQVRMVTPDVPFILVSGQVGEEAAAELMRAGANDFVLKGRLARLVPAVQRELRDANERRQRRTAQSALRVSEERFRLLAEHAQDIIFRYRRSPEPGLEYVSPAVEHITGFTPDELYADHELIFDLIEPDDRTRFVASWRSADPAALTVRWRGRDGTLVYLEQRATTVTDEEGVVVAVEGILRDTTDQTLAEEDRRRLEHQLRQNERLDSLGHLAGGVAHDFNNLLAVVSGYCDVLAEDLPPDSPNVADVDCIRKAAERGASLTRQLLIFSRLEPSRTERLNLNTVVAETRDLLSRTLGEDISVATVLADDVRPVRADRSKMEQVLLNVAVNARAAMPGGGMLTIETADDGDHVLLTVTDDGHGMPPDVLQRAFEPFFTTRPKGEGTGLGLATAYGAVTDVGGTIDLVSEVGAGTTVRIRLPVAVAADETAGRVPGAEAAPARDASVLLVEDEQAVREMMLRQLSRSPYDVCAVGSPVEALRMFTEEPDRFDLLLTDIVMPGMSGTQLADHIRRVRPDLPVLFMSGYTAGHAPGGQEMPSDGTLLHKPFDRAALLDALGRTLGAVPTR
jgi:PAS domain S-box-containing protein